MTTGGWEVENDEDTFESWNLVDGEDGEVIAVFAKGPTDATRDRQWDNAITASAAPELLAALQGAYEQLIGPAMVWGNGIGNDGTKSGPTHEEFCELRKSRIQAARTAIAKATRGRAKR